MPAAVVLVALVAAWPAMAEPGLLATRGGGDSPFLLQRLHQLTAALADGHFPVRWMPDAAYGDGYPFYNYYAPLSIYVAAAFRALGFSFVRAIHLAQLAGFVVAGLGAYWLARRWLGSPWAGLLAAVAYTAAPFHMVNVYVRGDSLAEFWAMAFYPWALLAADNLARAIGAPQTGASPRPAGASAFRALAIPVALFALVYAALILSHNISALIFSPFLLGWLLWRMLARAQEREGAVEQGKEASPLPPGPPAPLRLLSAAIAVALALSLAAWFFIPALAEQDLAQLGPVTEGYFHFSNHFRGQDLVQGDLLFDYNPDGGVAFRMGLAQLALAVAGGVVLWLGRQTTDHRPRPEGTGASEVSEPAATSGQRSSVVRRPSPDRRPLVLFITASFLLATLMITPLSRPLWEHLPLLPFSQFPWRFLSVQALFGALLTGGLATVKGRAGPWLAVVGSVVLLAAGLLGLRLDYLYLTDADVTAERLAQYEWFTGNIGTTISAEYLTPAATPRPWTSAWLNDAQRDWATGIDGELLSAALLSRSATQQTWALEAAPDGATVLLPTLFWPGWRATIDGQAATLAAQLGSGLMALSVPAGEHTATLTLGRTATRAAAEWLSLAAGVVVVGLLVIGGRNGLRIRTEMTDLYRDRISAQWPAIGLLMLGLPVLALIWRGDPQVLPDSDLTWDFAQLAFLHHSPDGVAFEDGARLHSYAYSTDAVRPGETLTVTLRLTPAEGEATLALVTPIAARPLPDDTAAPPALVAAARAQAETLVFALSIPVDAPPGLYLPRLTLDGGRPLMPSGRLRGDLFLRPIRIERRTTDDGETTHDVDVWATELTLRDGQTVEGSFKWYTAWPLGARYQFSWRLQDAAGGVLAQLDAQPGYGFQPSVLWPAGEGTADRLALQLPNVAPAEGDYPLVMRLYDPAGGQVILTRRVGAATWRDGAWAVALHKPSYDLPADLTPLAATFGDPPTISLPGYRLERDGDTLRLTLYWQALAGAPGDYTRFVHLLAPDGANADQRDGAPAGDSLPTGQWLAGEVVTDELTFDLSTLPPGDYRLATGFYFPTEGLPRLPTADATGQLLPDGRVLLPEVVTVR